MAAAKKSKQCVQTKDWREREGANVLERMCWRSSGSKIDDVADNMSEYAIDCGQEGKQWAETNERGEREGANVLQLTLLP